MNKHEAQTKIWAGITNGELAKLLEDLDIEALCGQSVVNPTMTKLQIYEILRGVFNDPDDTSMPKDNQLRFLSAVNALREFGN